MVTDISLKYVLSYRRYASCYCSMLALHDRPVLAMVNILALELYQLLQYLYVCSSCWMSTIPTVCRGSRQVVTALFEP